MNPNDALRILGLEAGASADDVKRAWRDLAQVWHPDRFESQQRLQEKAAAKLQEINEAYEILKDGADLPSPAPRTPPPVPEGPVGTSRRPSMMVLGFGRFRATGEVRTERKRWWWPF